MNKLELTDKQLQVIELACDVLHRIEGGQLRIALDEMSLKNPDSAIEKFEHNKKHLAECVFRELCFDKDSTMNDPNASTWEGNSWALIASDIRQTIRKQFAYRENPEGGSTTNFHDPMGWGNEPIPEISPLNNTDEQKNQTIKS